MAKSKKKGATSATEEGTNKKVSSPEAAEAEENESEPAADVNTADDGEEPSGVWDLIRVIHPSEKDKTCRMDDCNCRAVSVWVEDIKPDDHWPLCEPCQESEFGGWPKDVEPPKEEEEKIDKEQDKTKEEGKKMNKSTGNDDEEDDTVDKDDEQAPGDTTTKNASSNDDQDGSEDYDPSQEPEDKDEDEEVWDVKKIMSIADVTNECPIKCSTETCTLPAACAYISNLAPTVKWYTCLDCQEKDFGGWPDVSDLPVKHLTQQHLDTLASKCSHKKDIEMPVFDDAASPSKDEANQLVSHTVTPIPNGDAFTQTASKKTKGKQTSITPSPAVGLKSSEAAAAKKPSKQVLAMHRKWQEAAEALGGPDARIVVSKPAAKKLIFDLLHDAFRPMNITQIYKELKAVVPSPVLKACLDDMAFDKSSGGDAFADSDDEEEDEGKKKKKATSNDPFDGSLSFKSAKSSNASLYYVDHTKLKNNGNGLEIDARNELASEKGKAEAEEAALKATLKQMTAETNQLLSEPKNEEATARLETEESALADLQSQAEAARKLKVNEKHKLKTKRRIENMATQWRKRRRICMDFLIALEENTEGSISVKKCLAGDGPIDIDSDEAVAKAAVAFASKKRSLPMASKKRSMAAAKKPKLSSSEESGLTASESFVAVTLDSQGCVTRVHTGEETD